jgi:DNA-binding MarR family transcriptional regulator
VGAIRWLDDDEQRTWRTFLIATRLLLNRLDADLQRVAAMPMAYYELLVLLSEAPGRTMRMKELASRSLSKPSRLSHAVNRLEELGWIRREHAPNDRRGWLAVLTDEGRAALEAAAPDHVESVRAHLLDQLTPAQLKQLEEISQALVDHLAPGRRAHSTSPPSAPGHTRHGPAATAS